MRLTRIKFIPLTKGLSQAKTYLAKEIVGYDAFDSFTYDNILSFDRRDRGHYVINHKSGFRLGSTSNKEKAKLILKELSSITDWNKSAEELRKIKDLGRQTENVIDAANNM